MKFIKSNAWLIFVIILASVIRLVNLDKPGGLWYDEMTIYSIASKSFPAGMLQTDSHRFLLFPIYYFLYHLWICVFGNSDFVIRLMSVFFDVLSVIAAYFAGVSFGKFIDKDKRLQSGIGVIYSLLYAVNSSFIYYAQEAKFYSLTFFLINIMIICWLRFLKETDIKSCIIFLLANFFLIYTYTSQILLSLIVMGVTVFYFASEHKLKSVYKYILLSLTVYIPLAGVVLFNRNYFSGNFTAVVYDNTFILLVLQNFFSPVLTGLQNNVLKFSQVWLSGVRNPIFWIFVMFPVVFCLWGIVKAFKDYKIIRFILLVPITYICIHIILSNFSSYKVLVRYILMALPFLLLAVSVGVCTINKNLKNTLVALYVLVSLAGIFSLNGAVNIQRPDGYKILAESLIKNSINPQFEFILPIRTELLDKYYLIKGNKHSLYQLNSEEALKTYLTENEIAMLNTDKQNLHKYYRRYFLSANVTEDFEKYVENTFMLQNEIVVLRDKSISMFSQNQIKMIVQSENYEKYPLQFLRLSKLNNDLLLVLSKNLSLKKHINVNNWEIFVFGI